jgi:ribosomal protein L10
VLAGEDPATPAKVVRDFAKEHDARPVVKIGVVDRREVTPDEVALMADLPSRDVLLASIAGALTASVGGIAGALAAVIRDVAFLIEEVAKKGEGGELTRRPGYSRERTGRSRSRLVLTGNERGREYSTR